MKHTYMLCPVADTVLPRPRGRAERWGQTQSWEVLYDLGLTSPLVSLCVCVFYTYHKLTGNGNICLAQRARPTGF